MLERLQYIQCCDLDIFSKFKMDKNRFTTDSILTISVEVKFKLRNACKALEPHQGF
jgi:hypothetical protein